MTTRRLAAARTIALTFGVGGLARRALFEVRRRFGLFRLQPRTDQAWLRATSLPASWPFRADASAVASATDSTVAQSRVKQVLAGQYQAYRARWIDLPSTRGSWNRNPETGFLYDASSPWHLIPHLAAEAGDIKDVWEPARFGWTYDLMRGWMLNRDDRCASVFWSHFEEFVGDCPAFRGVQWSCGQEVAIRSMAWLWAEAVFGDAPSTTPDRAAALRLAIGWSGERISDAFGYAISQRNNHGISEAAALVMIGARFRAHSVLARRWLNVGRRALSALISDQIAADGWYIQHSMNYTRLALDQLIMAEITLRSVGSQLPRTATGRVRAAIRLLALLCDPDSGEAPNHGANDGAYVLPLSLNEFRDFRPTLTAASAVFGEPLPANIAAQAEPLAWLNLDAPHATPPPTLPFVAHGPSGWVVGRTARAQFFARAAKYRSRPSHVDPLHVDLWLDGSPVAIDAGTYRYNADSPWRNALAAVQVHNTLSIEGSPPAERGPRFLWLSWPNAVVRSVNLVGEEVRVEMENLSWKSLGVQHVRTCLVGPAGATVLDEVRSRTQRGLSACIQWLLACENQTVMVRSTCPIRLAYSRGDPGSICGWRSESYGEKKPATSVQIHFTLDSWRSLFASGFGDHRDEEHLRQLLDAASQGERFDSDYQAK